MSIIQFFRTLKTKIRKQFFGLAGVDFDKEVYPYLCELKGLVFNAGAGIRPITLGLPTLATDFDQNALVDFLSDLHYIPLKDGSVDSIISIAVLEHTRYPWVVIQEFARILKPGGSLVFCVPFLQPEHAVPHDFFRYTVYGVESLLKYAGFEIKSQHRLSRYHRAVGWILNEKWAQKKGVLHYFQLFLINQISRRQRDEETAPFSIYTGSYTVATKPGDWKENESAINTKEPWFKDLLVDPITKEPLRLINYSYFENSKGQRYEKVNGKYDFKPKDGLSQDDQVKWGEKTIQDESAN